MRNNTQLHFIGNGETMYNMTVSIQPMIGEKYTADCVKVSVVRVKINSRDSYETCKERMNSMEAVMDGNYSLALDSIEPLTYCFQYPVDADGEYRLRDVKNPALYSAIMEKVLKSLDLAIDKVEPLTEVDNSFVIRMENRSVILQEGRGLYYCDEKFSYINSDTEKAAVSVMIDALGENEQLFFTTHNSDMLDLPLPKHSFLFMKSARSRRGTVWINMVNIYNRDEIKISKALTGIKRWSMISQLFVVK